MVATLESSPMPVGSQLGPGTATSLTPYCFPASSRPTLLFHLAWSRTLCSVSSMTALPFDAQTNLGPRAALSACHIPLSLPLSIFLSFSPWPVVQISVSIFCIVKQIKFVSMVTNGA